MNTLNPNLEPWQWPEEHWRKLVNRGRARFDEAVGRYSRADYRRPAGRAAHAILGFQPAHSRDRTGDGAALRYVADERRGLLRVAARRRTHRRRRVPGRMGAGRRRLF